MAEKKKNDEVAEEAAPDAPEATEEKAAPNEQAEEAPKKSEPKKPDAKKAAAKTDGPAEDGETRNKRAEKVGVVFSDKMTKTVVVRVDRTVKHALYHKYMKKRKKFMAHNDMGAVEGDKVRIVETRPLSARKRWRVVEIIQKAQK